jgi:dihydroxy-acid dehydratase
LTVNETNSHEVIFGRNVTVFEIDIPIRSFYLAIDTSELKSRRAVQDAKGWHPAEKRKRNVTTALKAYAAFAASADKGAVRQLPE